MPISQYRMISLLDGAIDCFQALTSTLTSIETICALYQTDQQTATECLASIYDIAKRGPYALLKPETIQTLFTERAHFTQARIRFNDRVRDKQARRRGRDPYSIPSNVFGGPPLKPEELPTSRQTLSEFFANSKKSHPPTAAQDDSEGIISSNESLFNPKEEGG